MMTAMTTARKELPALLRMLGAVAAGAVILLAAAPFALAQDTATAVPAAPEATLSVESTLPAPQKDSSAVPADIGTANTTRQNFDNTALLAIADAKGRLRDASVLPEAVPTLFFTAWQHALLQEAKIGFKTSLPDPGEVGSSGNPARTPGIRELALGGIAFGDPSKWTVWLNGVRITPNAIPDQVLDIKVSRAYIDLKWYDSYTNKIYPVRMRPHERFNLDSRIFLPGTGAM